MSGIPANSSFNTVLQARLKAVAAIACARSGHRSAAPVAGASRLRSRYRLPSSKAPEQVFCNALHIDPTDILGPAAAPKTP